MATQVLSGMEKGSLEKMGAAFTEMNRHFEEMYQATFAIQGSPRRGRTVDAGCNLSL